MDAVKVSIICAVYNHERYIRSALESFISQKTTFPYEIIVHDDASTDDSARIIEEYAERYPHLIKAICQTENQVSQHISPVRDIMIPQAKGTYIALCEGDDYWTDDHKLQKQFDYMESHPDCTFCFTNGKLEQDGVLGRDVIPWERHNRVLLDERYDVVALDGLGYIPTASFFFPRTAFLALPVPENGVFRGDAYLKFGLTLQGYAAYIPDCCVVYRFGVSGSATTRWKKSAEEYHRWADRFVKMYRWFDEITEVRYHDVFEYNALWWECSDLQRQGRWDELKESRFHRLYKRGTVKQRLRFFLLCHWQWLFRRLFRRGQ